MNFDELFGDYDWAALYDTVVTTGLEFGFRIIVAIVIYLVGRIVARILTNTVRKIMKAREIDLILETFVCNLVYWVVMLFVIIAAINHVGIETTSLIAVIGAAGLAIGLALQGSLANFAAGVLIVLFRPYRVGDFVEVAGVSGSVLQVQILTTILKTGDNKQVIIPNGEIMSNIITNYSAHDTRRVDIMIGIGYDDDIDKAKATLKQIVEAEDRVLDEPKCLIAVAELADSSVNLHVRPWVKTSDYWAVMFALTEAIKKRFDEESISFPYPQQDVHLFKEES